MANVGAGESNRKERLVPRVSQQTWDTLITLGYLEERREGDAANQRLLRLTEKGRRAADGHRYSGIS